MTAFAIAVLFGATFTRSLERVSTMDPAFAQSLYDSRAIQLAYEPPLAVDYEARPYRLAAGYAELPQVSKDGLTYTFKTVRGPAADMVRSLRRLEDKDLVSPNGWILKDVTSIEETATNEVRITLRRRVHYFPWLMAMSACAVRDEKGEGTGPYRLTKWRKNHEMVFEGVEAMEGGFNQVRYLVVDDVTTQWLMFLKGELDFLGDISRDNFDSVVGKDGRLLPELSSRGIKLHTLPSMDVMFIGINMKDKVVGTNRKLRQALNAAFDYPTWEQFYNGRILPSTGPVPPGVEGRLETPFAYEFNLENAKRLLAEAGYAEGTDPQTGRRLTLRLAIGRASQSSREQGELLAAFYERIGIKLELEFMTWDAFLKAVNEGRTQLYNMGWVGDYPDAQNFLQLFHSANVSPGPNHSAYSNADYDAAYEAALNALSVEERNRQWHRCQEILREDCPWIFTHYNKVFTLTGPRVGNYNPSVFPYGNERYYRVNKSCKISASGR